MDDLSFRKAVLAEPFNSDPALIEAAKQDPEKQAFWQEVKAMESQLQEAMNVPVPEQLADKLILRQTLRSHSASASKRPWYGAIAASFMLVAVITIATLGGGEQALARDVIAHAEHAEYEVSKSLPATTASINKLLAAYNGKLNGNIGEVMSANYCYLNEIKSLHLIIKGEKGLSSLFVMGDADNQKIDSRFSEKQYIGSSFILESAKIIIVGEDADEVEWLQQQARLALNFSA